MKIRILICVWLLAMVAMAETGLPAWPDDDEGGESLALLPPVEETGETPGAVELPAIPSESVSEGENAFTALPREFWDAYFAERPSKFLLDPQGLLAPVDFRERLVFLDYHSDDSRIDLYVYVFAGDQEIPAAVRDEELMERFFSGGRPVALLYYFLGEPERAVLKLTPSLAARISAVQRHRTLESPMIQASREVEPARQFEAFLV